MVVDDAGTPRLNADSEPMSVSEFFRDFSSKKLHLVRGNTIPGGNARGSDGSASSLPPRIKVEEIFGPRSSSRAASDLMRRSPQEYRRLKEEAISKGIL